MTTPIESMTCIQCERTITEEDSYRGHCLECAAWVEYTGEDE